MGLSRDDRGRADPPSPQTQWQIKGLGALVSWYLGPEELEGQS